MGDKQPENAWNAFPSTSRLLLGPETLPRRFGEWRFVAAIIHCAFGETNIEQNHAACRIVK